MKSEKDKNENLGEKRIKENPNESNMPSHLIPANHSDEHTAKNVVEPEDEDLGKGFGKGDFGAEGARSDEEKGNKGSAGNMPFSKEEG